MKPLMIRRLLRSTNNPAGEFIETPGWRLNEHFGLIEVEDLGQLMWMIIHLGSGLSPYRTQKEGLARQVAQQLLTSGIDWNFVEHPLHNRTAAETVRRIITKCEARFWVRPSTKVLLGAMLCWLLYPSLASAQAITSWTLRIFNTGAPVALSTTSLLAANVICNQAQPPAGSAVNPSRVVFDDAITLGRVCIWTDPGAGPLFSVPFGGAFEASLTATNIAGTSAESARASFTRPGLAPGVPMGVRLVGP